MNQFSASDLLVEQVLANGFAEVTEQYFPHCHVRLQQKGETYHPAYFQRAFRFSAGTALIILHYLTIRVLYKSHVVAESRRLSEEELQTLMTFCKLPAKRQAALAAKRLNLAELKTAVDAEPKLAD